MRNPVRFFKSASLVSRTVCLTSSVLACSPWKFSPAELLAISFFQHALGLWNSQRRFGFDSAAILGRKTAVAVTYSLIALGQVVSDDRLDRVIMGAILLSSLGISCLSIGAQCDEQRRLQRKQEAKEFHPKPKCKLPVKRIVHCMR